MVTAATHDMADFGEWKEQFRERYTQGRRICWLFFEVLKMRYLSSVKNCIRKVDENSARWKMAESKQCFWTHRKFRPNQAAVCSGSPKEGCGGYSSSPEVREQCGLPACPFNPKLMFRKLANKCRPYAIQDPLCRAQRVIAICKKNPIPVIASLEWCAK